jgi:hypothetical protein
MKLNEGLAIAGALLDSSGVGVGKALSIPLDQENKKKDRAALIAAAKERAKIWNEGNVDDINIS